MRLKAIITKSFSLKTSTKLLWTLNFNTTIIKKNKAMAEEMQKNLLFIQIWTKHKFSLKAQEFQKFLMSRFTKKFKFSIWARKGSIFEQITPQSQPQSRGLKKIQSLVRVYFRKAGHAYSLTRKRRISVNMETRRTL